MSMGLLDRAKQQAQDLSRKVEGKVDDVQSKRKVGDLLEQLGRIAYAEQTGRAVASGDADGAKIIADLKALEDQGVGVLTDGPAAGDATTAGPPPAPSPAPAPAPAPEAAPAPAPEAAPAPATAGAPPPPPPLPGGGTPA
jgi:hypothetical protein